VKIARCIKGARMFCKICGEAMSEDEKCECGNEVCSSCRTLRDKCFKCVSNGN
jgi:hypothetical protein